MNILSKKIYGLIVKTSTDMPEDVENALSEAAGTEKGAGNSLAYDQLTLMLENIQLARSHSLPLCQDTGRINFFIDAPAAFDKNKFIDAVEEAVVKATDEGILRKNSVCPVTGKNTGNNLGIDTPAYYWNDSSSVVQRGRGYDTRGGTTRLCSTDPKLGESTETLHWHDADEGVRIRLLLKGGGSENVGAQYSLPDPALSADRDMDGVKKCIVDAVKKAEGKGCPPSILSVCIGGDRASGYAVAKKALFRKIGERSANSELAIFEEEVLEEINSLGIGTMGLGGSITALDLFMTAVHRHPASFFVTISQMCWSCRRGSLYL